MAATGVFPMSAVIFRIFLVRQSLRVECASELLITYIYQLRKQCTFKRSLQELLSERHREKFPSSESSMCS